MSKKILFFDTETTGLLEKDKNAPLEAQPHLLQFWYILGEYEKDGTILKETMNDLYFNPGVPIPEQASSVHGITDEMVADKPPFESFAELLTALVRTVDIVVCHNAEYDRRIVFIELDRLYPLDLTPGKKEWKEMFLDKEFCTMQATIDFCAIKSNYKGYKYPKLDELHKKLFWMGFDNAHNAMADIEATKKCYFELLNRNII